jgi:putative glutamine amidotransferase
MTDSVLIGVSARIYTPSLPVLDMGGVWTRTLHYLEQSVAHWVLAGGALVVMVPAVDSHSLVQRSEIDLDDYAAQLDGLLLQGGNDVSPTTYGETPLRPEWSGDTARDRYEMELVQAFLDAGKPVFGICRGMQLLNVKFGGTLYQDIQTQRPDARAHVDPQRYDQHHHEVELVPGSQLAALFPDRTRMRVNSIHHQAVKDLAPGFEVQARCPDDGIVEAFYRPGWPWVAGVQWHPEFHGADAGSLFIDDARVLAEFLAAARAARRRRRGG